MKPIIPLLTLYITMCFTACKKESGSKPAEIHLEPFAFTGTVKNCASGKSVKGIKIQAEAYRPGMLFSEREHVGTVYTDEFGQFVLRPRKVDFVFDKYVLQVYYPNGHYITEYFETDTIKKYGQSTYNFNFGVVELGYVRLNLNNVNFYDTSDIVYVKYYQKDVDCSINPPKYWSELKPVLGFGFKGIIKNGYVYRTGRADDSITIGWRVLRNGDTSVEQYINTYIRVNDSTTVDLNY